MTERRAQKEPAAQPKSDRGRDAKAEFQAYKQRMEHAAKASQAAGAFQPGSPLGTHMGVGGWPAYGGQSVGYAPAHGAPVYPPAVVAQAGDTAANLAGGLGLTFRLAVDLLNASLAGGTKLLQEFTHSGLAAWSGGKGGCGCHSSCGCAESCCEPCCASSCCQPSCCECDCCTPSVGTCC